MDNISDFAKLVGDKMGTNPDKFESLFKLLQASSDSSNSSGCGPNSDAEATNNGSSDSSFEMPDIETIMKIKKIMECMKSNQNDPIVNLLLSLKPFLQESKKSIIDQLIKFIGFSNALYLFNEQKP